MLPEAKYLPAGAEYDEAQRNHIPRQRAKKIKANAGFLPINYQPLFFKI